MLLRFLRNESLGRRDIHLTYLLLFPLFEYDAIVYVFVFARCLSQRFYCLCQVWQSTTSYACRLGLIILASKKRYQDLVLP